VKRKGKKNYQLINACCTSGSPVVFRLKVTDANQNTSFDSVTIRFSRFLALPDGTSRSLALGDTLSIYSTVGGGIRPLTRTWSPNYNISNINAESPRVWPRRSTNYYCRTVDSAGCVSGFIDGWIINLPVSGTNEIRNEIQVSVYPNPITAASQLSINSENSDEKTLRIYNALGQVIHTQKIAASKTTIGQWITQSGVYLYQISNGSKVLATGQLAKD
jgi:hypothetical protein